MKQKAATFFSLEADSEEAGRVAGEALLKDLGGVRPKAVLLYATMNHDQPQVLSAFRAAIGPDVPVLGCSVQGVVGNDELTEDGLALGAMAFAGDALSCAVALQRDIQVDAQHKGRLLAQELKKGLGQNPTAIILLYDPLCGLDVEAMLSGIGLEVSCPLIGGGAGQPFGPPIQTFQYWDEEVLSHSVVALGLSGPFAVEIGICHGTASTGASITVTKSQGNQILELDGQPAMDLWRRSSGFVDGETVHQEHMAAWALGIERRTVDRDPGHITALPAIAIRGAFGFDESLRSVIFQAAIPEGSRVTLQHRTVENVLEGTRVMADELGSRLTGQKSWAVLGFECAARTFPFLGCANTREEHKFLRNRVAPTTPWLGMMAWGEIGPCGGQPAFHNYTYPLVVFVDKAA